MTVNMDLTKFEIKMMCKVKVIWSAFCPAACFAHATLKVLAVFIFMRAWKEQDNFERSSDLTRLGWFFNTMGTLLESAAMTAHLFDPRRFFGNELDRIVSK